MGNCLFSCFNPTVEDDYDQFPPQIIEKRRDQEILLFGQDLSVDRVSTLQKSCNIYTINEDLNNLSFHNVSHSTLNDHRLSTELFNVNLTEMSREIQCLQSDLSLDSGFNGSRADILMNCSLDMVSIRADSLSKYTNTLANTLYRKSLSFCFNLINISLTNMPFLLKTNVNHVSASKKGFKKHSLFSSKFIEEMKGKYFVNPIKRVGHEQTAIELTGSCKNEQASVMIDSKEACSNIDYAQAVYNGANSAKNFLSKSFLKIYDVNFY